MREVKMDHGQKQQGLSEAAVRSFAKRRGYLVTRCRHIYPLNLGKFALVRASDNAVVFGVNFSADLKEIRGYLDTAQDLGPVPSRYGTIVALGTHPVKH
jgi:hypothetical protein